MKAAQLVGILVAGAVSTMAVGSAQAEGGFPGLEKIKERWEKRFTDQQALKDKITEDLKKQDAELEKIQSDLKSASGEKKIDALTEAVNTLIDQRLQMNKKMEEHLNKFSSEKKDLPGESGSELKSDDLKSNDLKKPDALPTR